MKKVLFVCTGNTCRSPMAEALFKLYLKNKGIESIEVKSAGLAAFTGDEVSQNAVKAAKTLGADISNHRAKRLSLYDVEEADLIFCMTDTHCKALENIADEDRLFLPKNQISDPFGGTYEDYLHSAKTIISAFDDVLNALFPFEIIPMSQEYIDEVLKIENECFSIPWTKSMFIFELEKEDNMFYIALLDKNLAAYICADNILGEVHINNIAVKKEFRRLSIGRTLVKHIINISRKIGASLITLEVRESNKAAISLYESLGFENLGKRRAYYSKPHEDAYIMTKFLDREEQI